MAKEEWTRAEWDLQAAGDVATRWSEEPLSTDARWRKEKIGVGRPESRWWSVVMVMGNDEVKDARVEGGHWLRSDQSDFPRLADSSIVCEPCERHGPESSGFNAVHVASIMFYPRRHYIYKLHSLF